MTGERTEKALARLERALHRIETASSRARAGLAEQTRKNDRLRQAIAETLRDLDLLIAEGDAKEDAGE